MRENVGYKVLALVMAVVLWAWVNNGRNPAKINTSLGEVQVQYTGLPKGSVLTDSPAVIKVFAAGPQSLIRSIDASRLKATADLSEAQPGTQDVKLDINLPQDLVGKVTLTPAEVKVKIEAFKRKLLKIEASLEGAPPLGYAFGAASADPSAAVVSGRGSRVDRVRRLIVSVKSAAAQSEGGDYYPVAALDAGGNKVEGVTIEPSSVTVKLDLIEAQATKSVIVSPDVTGQPAYPHKVASVSVSPPAVTIFGKANRVVNIGEVSTERIDISNTADSVVRTAKLIIPSGVTCSVKTVRVVVKVVEPGT